MMKKHLLSLITLLALTTANLTHAQSEPLATHLEATAHPLPGDAHGWLGEPITGRIDVVLCWDGIGGSNPTTGNFTVIVSGHAPRWVNLTITPTVIPLTPPKGPTQVAGCTDPTPVLVTMSAPDGVIPDSPVHVNVTFAALEQEATVGNFAAPNGNTASFYLHSVPSSGQPPDDDDDRDGGDDGDDGNDGDADNPGDGDDESPGPGRDNPKMVPGPTIVALVALVVSFVALRRRLQAGRPPTRL